MEPKQNVNAKYVNMQKGRNADMKKIKNTVLAAVCCTGLMVLGCVGLAQAQDVSESTGTRQQREV